MRSQGAFLLNYCVLPSLSRSRISEFVLFDLNRAVNEEMGREVFDIGGFRREMEHQVVISYKNVSEITSCLNIMTWLALAIRVVSYFRKPKSTSSLKLKLSKCCT